VLTVQHAGITGKSKDYIDLAVSEKYGTIRGLSMKNDVHPSGRIEERN
jgi:hypothetical protein